MFSRRIAPVVAVACFLAVPAEARLAASPKFRDAVAQAQTSLSRGDLAGAGTQVASLAPSTPLEKYMVASLAMELAVKRNDTVAQRKAVAQILESGAAPDGQLGHLNKIAGYLSYQTGAIDNAIVYLTRARSLGEVDPQTSLMLVESYVRKRRNSEAAQILDEAIAQQVRAGQPVPASWYDRASSLSYSLRDWRGVARNGAAKLAAMPVNGPDWRSEIMTYVEGAKPEAEAMLDLYRLQAATGALASERDYQGYASLAAGQGYAAEAKAVIDAGQSTDRLSRVDPVALSLMRTLKTKAVANLAAIRILPGKAASVSNGIKAAKAGDDLFANSQFSEAVPYFRAALEKGGVDRDRVSTRLGIGLARSGDLEGAQASLSQVKAGNWGDVAAFWLAWIASKRAAVQASASSAQPPTG